MKTKKALVIDGWIFRTICVFLRCRVIIVYATLLSAANWWMHKFLLSTRELLNWTASCFLFHVLCVVNISLKHVSYYSLVDIKHSWATWQYSKSYRIVIASEDWLIRYYRQSNFCTIVLTLMKIDETLATLQWKLRDPNLSRFVTMHSHQRQTDDGIRCIISTALQRSAYRSYCWLTLRRGKRGRQIQT